MYQSHENIYVPSFNFEEISAHFGHKKQKNKKTPQHSLIALQVWDMNKMNELMSGIIISSSRHREVANSYILHCFELQRFVHTSATRCLIEIGFGSK